MSQPSAVEPTPIQRQVEGEIAPVPGTTTIEHLGRSWVVPTKRHFRHLSHMRTAMTAGYGSVDLMIAETFLADSLFTGLPKGQVQQLWELNPTEEELDGFAKKIATALGLDAKDPQGN